MNKTVAALTALALLAGGVALAQGAVSETMALMKSAVEPASNLVFAVQGETDPELGGEPAADARWEEAVAAVETLKTAAAALEAMPSPDGGPEWKAASQKMAGHVEEVGAAARAKDAVAFSAGANGLLESCSSCHEKYLSAPQ